jgi:biuret amidohydrolase
MIEVDARSVACDAAQRVFAGPMTEVCVETSMPKANDGDHECLLVENAAAGYLPAFKTATLERIRAEGAIADWTTPVAALKRAIA